MNNLFYTLTISLFFSSTLLSMEEPKLLIEQKYVEKTSYFLNFNTFAYFFTRKLPDRIMDQSNLKSYKDRIDSLKETLKQSPDQLFRTIRDLPNSDPFCTTCEALGIWEEFSNLAYGYCIEKEGHYVAKTFDALKKLRLDYEKTNNADTPGYSEQKKVTIERKIEKIDTWYHKLQESPEEISDVLKEIADYFGEAHEACIKFLNINIKQCENEEQRKILPILQTIGTSLNTLLNLRISYLMTALNMATNKVLEN